MQTAHIFGAGPSLKDYALKQDWSKKLTFGTNALPLILKTKHWVMVDTIKSEPMLEWFKTDTETTKFVSKHLMDSLPEELKSKATYIKHQGHGPCSTPARDGCYWHGSVVMAAMEVARIMGCTTFVLWGIDYNNVEHAYDDKDNILIKKNQWNWDMLQRTWGIMAEYYPQLHCEVFNANPKSKLKVFPLIEPNKALAL